MPARFISGEAVPTDGAVEMTVRSLQEAFQACGEDLRKDESFARYYIAREDGASLELAERMAMDKRPVKALFAGQKGAGKTTELLRVVRDCVGTLYPVYIPMDHIHEKSGIPELLSAIGLGMLKKLQADKINLSDAVMRSLLAWLKDALKVPGDEKGGVSGVTDIFAKLSEKLKKKEARAEIAAALESRRDELASKLTELANDVKARTNREVLLVIDGTERLGKTQALMFLLESSLLDLGFKTICTVPFQLLHSAEFRDLRKAFDLIAVQPLVDISTQVRGLPKGATDLRDMVDKRVGGELVDSSALDQLIQNSGGNPGELLRFLGSCCIKASMQGKSRIEARTVEQVLEDFRLEMKRFLSAEEWHRLTQIQRDRNTPSDETLSSLLESGAVLEFPGKKDMYQVHPALLPVLKERMAGA